MPEKAESLEEAVRVVVVDDVPDIADTLACALGLDGYDVRTAHDGRSALAVIEDHQPLAVLLDIDMPGLDGHALSRELRQRHGDDIVLIAITGWGDADDRVSPAFASVDHCLRKPIDMADLRRLLPPLNG